MAANVTFTNITVGESDIFIGPQADYATIDTDITNNGLNSTYNVGATQEGCAISWEPDMVDIDVDQFGDAARIIQNRQRVMVKTTLAEATLTNLAHAWGYADGVASNEPGLVTPYTVASGGTLNVGLHSVYPSEKCMFVFGYAPGSTDTTRVWRKYSCRRAIQYSASEHSNQRADNVKYAVEFRLLPDSGNTGNEYGTIQDGIAAPY